MAHELSLPAVRVKQKESEKEIFISSIKAKELIDSTQFKIDYWDSNKKNEKSNGYQRRPAQPRVDKIARFAVGAEAIFPTSILINSREQNGITFRGETEGSDVGHVKFNTYPMWIVDGQHRIEGIKHAINKYGEKSLENLEFPVVLMSGFNELEEINQFNVLNTTQKKVSTDLAQRLMQTKASSSNTELNKLVAEGNDWQLKVLKIIDPLNERPDSPWFRKIKLPNEENKPSFIISQNSFLQSLRPLYKDGYFKISNNLDLEYEAIKNYWMALHQIFPDAFAIPKEYVIQKTPGVFTLHSLLSDILLIDKSIDQKSFNEKLNHIFSIFGKGSDFWRSSNPAGASLYGSMKGFRILSEEFSKGLKSYLK